MKRLLAMLLAAALLLSLLAGCGGNDRGDTNNATPQTPVTNSAGTPVPDMPVPTLSEYFADLGESPYVSPYTGEKILNEGKLMTTFNPHMYTSTNEMPNYGSLTIRMAARDRSGEEEMLPYHAKSLPQTTDGGYTWKIEVREGLSWSDGTPLDANDYYYSMKMLIDPKLSNTNANRLYKAICVVNAEEYFKGNCEWEDVGIKLIDDYHLEMTLVYPVSDMVFWASMRLIWPVYEEMYEAGMNADHTSTTYGTTLEETPSCGYFLLTEWVLDDHYRYVKNENDPLVQAGYIIIDGVYSRAVGMQNATSEEMFSNGQLDWDQVGLSSYEKYKNDPRIYPNQSAHMWGLFVNSTSTNPVMQDINFRKALYYGTDRELLVSSTNPMYAPNSTMLSSKLPITWEDGSQSSYRETEAGTAVAEKYQYDPEQALEYFEQAYTSNGSQKIIVNIIYSDSNDVQKRMVEILQQEWPNLFGGDRIEITLSAMPQKNAYNVYREGSYDLGFGSRNANSTVLADSLGYYTSNYSDKYITGFLNEEFDELYERCVYGDLSRDPQGMTDALSRMEDLMLDYVAYIPIYQNNTRYMFQDWIELVTEVPCPSVGFSIYQCDINPNH